MRKKSIVKIVHEKLFNANIALVVGRHEDFLTEAKKFLEKDKYDALEKMVKEKGQDDWCLATQFPFNGGGSIIWAIPNANLGTLVHEVVHDGHHLLECRSVPLSSDTEEVYAYLIEFLFNGLIK